MRIACCLLGCLLSWSWLDIAAGGSEPDARPLNLLTTQNPDGSLAGWKFFSENPQTRPGDVWKLTSEGVLICKGQPQGYLFTDKDHRDFVLTLQWRTPPGKTPGRGGVLLRMSGAPKIWPKSLEAQLNAGDEGDFWGLDGFVLSGPSQRLKTVEDSPFGKLTNLKKTEASVRAPGEWNRYEIIADSDSVTLKINGREVNRATGCDTIGGPICLTSEGDEIHFRDIRLSPLPRREK